MSEPEAKGVPAIAPRVQLSDAAALTTPAITAEDALAYMADHSAFMIQTLVPPTVVGAQFMTDAEFLARFGSEPGLASNELLCVVEVHGRFRQLGVPPGVTPRVYDVFYSVFNARTGNFLMGSAPGSLMEPESI